jgi:hypothetical protein
MSDRLKLPLSHKAVSKADDQFYATHPKFIQDGRRIPLDATDPAQGSLRRDWVKLYLANGGQLDGTSAPQKRPEDTTVKCPACKRGNGRLVVTVVDFDDNPIEGALVTANGLQKTTNARGVADFGEVPADTYSITARKDGYTLVGVTSHYDPHDKNVVVETQETATATITLTDCVAYRLTKRPLLIAQASEKLLPPIQTLAVPGSVDANLHLDFGQDTTFGFGGRPVTGVIVPENEQGLRKAMYRLLDYFAQGDADGKARREFDAFLGNPDFTVSRSDRPPGTIQVYTDPALDKAIESAENFRTYPDRAMAAPDTPYANPSKPRIHQALLAAGFDVNRVQPVTDLVVPAFKVGDKYPFKATGDWTNGLAVMIDTVQYVLVFVDAYEYDMCKQQYTIGLIFELYDIFGLDDGDVKSYGVTSSVLSVAPQEGITAWWQLQHQYGYAPLITKAVVKKSYTVSTK